MNYNMQNMDKTLPELFSMLKSAEVEIKKEHQVLMVNKTTKFKKQGKSKKRETSRRAVRKLSRRQRRPRLGLSLILSAFTARERVTGSGISLSTWRILRTATSRRKVY